MNDDSFIHHFVDKFGPFIDAMPEDNATKLKAHIACYNKGGSLDGPNYENPSAA